MTQDSREWERRLTTLEVMIAAQREQLEVLGDWQEHVEGMAWRLLMGSAGAVGLAYLHAIALKLGL